MSELSKHPIHIRIRDLRRERALTQEELASALGLSRQSINAMEAGRCLPSLPVALQIAQFFSVPLGAVFAMGAEIAHQLRREQELPSMAMVPWQPLRDVREILQDLAAAEPAVNLWQDVGSVYVELSLPGFRSEELDIEAGEDFLTVTGASLEKAEEAARTYERREFMARSFRQTVGLPAVVRALEADAEMRHGVLLVTIPKLVASTARTARVAVRSME